MRKVLIKYLLSLAILATLGLYALQFQWTSQVHGVTKGTIEVQLHHTHHGSLFKSVSFNLLETFAREVEEVEEKEERNHSNSYFNLLGSCLFCGNQTTNLKGSFLTKGTHPLPSSKRHILLQVFRI